MFDGAWNGYDPLNGRIRIGFPPVRPRITIAPCKEYGITPDWLPTYGDFLCFEVSVNMPMEVCIVLYSSMYEGRAMNYDVEPTDWDAGDIIPWQVPGCISMPDGKNGLFFMFVDIDPREPRCLNFRVQDYAAWADLKAFKTDDVDVCAKVEIPYDYHRFLSNTDPDQDGLTSWEEYRGFVTNWGYISARSGGGMDSLEKDFFLDDQTGFIWSGGRLSALCSASGFYEIWQSENLSTLDSNDRSWLDYMISHTGSLADPGYNPPLSMFGGTMNDVDQAVCRIIVDDVPNPGFALTPQYPGNPPFFPGPSGTLGSVQIDWDKLDLVLNSHVANRGLPPIPSPLYYQVQIRLYTRTYLHELGHVFGIDHHDGPCDGLHDCVMKYEDFDDWPTDSAGWVQYSWGQGYLEDEWNCAGEKRLRP
ncbi:MAG: hypothetical protein PHI18_02040 [bacterium]|nr:hypothetical protein [bacterium]